MPPHDEADAQLAEDIRQLVLREWDPIGVSEDPDAADEYDAYIPDLLALLRAGSPPAQIFEYLWQLETEHMGLPGNRQHTQACAERLRLMT